MILFDKLIKGGFYPDEAHRILDTLAPIVRSQTKLEAAIDGLIGAGTGEQPSQVYKEKGFDSRHDYLLNLSEEYAVDKDVVFTLANMLGENEDFDGLINSVEDIQEYRGAFE